jgi:hypothetical protein
VSERALTLCFGPGAADVNGCQQKSRVADRGRDVAALDNVRLHRLAVVIADELRTGQGSTWRSNGELDDIAVSRRVGRLLGVSVRTGVAPDGSRVWVVEGP